MSKTATCGSVGNATRAARMPSRFAGLWSGASGANAPFNSGTGATGDLGGGAGYGSSGFGNSGDMGGASGYRDETGGLGGTTGGMGGGMHGVGGSMGADGGRRDQAREKLNDARERLGQAGAQARDWKQRAERGLAHRLEQGASRLRSRTQGGYGDAAYATGAGAGTSNVASDMYIPVSADSISPATAIRPKSTCRRWRREPRARRRICGHPPMRRAVI